MDLTDFVDVTDESYNDDSIYHNLFNVLIMHIRANWKQEIPIIYKTSLHKSGQDEKLCVVSLNIIIEQYDVEVNIDYINKWDIHDLRDDEIKMLDLITNLEEILISRYESLLIEEVNLKTNIYPYNSRWHQTRMTHEIQVQVKLRISKSSIFMKIKNANFS